MSPFDIPPSRDGSDLYLLINDHYVFSAKPFDGFPQGQISFSDPQRTWAGIALTDSVKVDLYDPFSRGGQAYLGSVDVEVGFAGRKTTDVPYDQDDLAQSFVRVCTIHCGVKQEYEILSLLTVLFRPLRIKSSHQVSSC